MRQQCSRVQDRCFKAVSAWVTGNNERWPSYPGGPVRVTWQAFDSHDMHVPGVSRVHDQKALSFGSVLTRSAFVQVNALNL